VPGFYISIIQPRLVIAKTRRLPDNLGMLAVHYGHKVTVLLQDRQCFDRHSQVRLYDREDILTVTSLTPTVGGQYLFMCKCKMCIRCR